MNILIASDSFKDSLTSASFGKIVSGVLRSKHRADVLVLSDGGEGALEVIAADKNFVLQKSKTFDALGREIEAEYAVDLKNRIAFIEMAKISGLELIEMSERDAKNTSTFGIGYLVRNIAKKGINNITLSIGGSATVDGGAGMLSALGLDFGQGSDRSSFITNNNLSEIEEIYPGEDFVEDLNFKIISDVDNVLLGETGAVYTYALQKGAKMSELAGMEAAMRNFSEKCREFSGVDYSKVKGSGAAGGVAFGLMNFYRTELLSGSDYFIEFSGLKERIKNYDIVISGEGSLDRQTLNSKLISGISSLCRKNNKKLFLVAGKIDREIIDSSLASRYYELRSYAKDLDDSISNADKYLKIAAERILLDLKLL